VTGRSTRPPPRSAPALSFLFPPSLGRAKASARAELLEQNLTNELGAPVSIRVTDDYADLERRALAGEAHLVWAPAGVCAFLEPVARAVFKAVRHGSATYRSALVVRKESRVTVDKLKGLRAAWVDPYSLGGYLLAVDHLRSLGVEPDQVFAEQTFHGSHPEALHALTGGSADLTAVTTGADDEPSIRAALSLHIGPVERKLSVLTVTAEAPTDAMVLTTQLPPDRAEQIAARFFPSDGAFHAPSFLWAAMGAEGFVRADPAEYRPLRRLFKRS
jgi:ABC-type phosphate/phosphonate transport system substrate-binding protein